MQSFRYKAMTVDHREITGVIESKDKHEALNKLRETFSAVIELSSVPVLSRELHISGKGTRTKQLALLCKQFGIILKAGLPIVRTIELVAEQTDNRRMKVSLGLIAEDVAGGIMLSDAFSLHITGLPSVFIETIRAGEVSGTLDNSFEQLSVYFTRTAKTREKVKSALTYPAFVIAVAIIVVFVVMVFAIPSFTNTFKSLNMELPFLTRMIIGLSDFVSKYIIFILLGIAAIIMCVRLWARSNKGGLAVARFALRLPIVGKIVRMSNSSQFARTISTMLYAGLPTLKAITISGNSMSNRVMSAAVLRCAVQIEGGRRIGVSLKDEPDIPHLLSEMTALGEETGELEGTLSVIADYYDNEVDVATTRALAMLEPTIICILAVFVILLLFAIYIPMFSIYNGF